MLRVFATLCLLFCGRVNGAFYPAAAGYEAGIVPYGGEAKLAEGTAAAGYYPAVAAPKYGAKIGLAEGVAASGYYPALAGGPAKLAYAEGAAAGFLPAYAAPKFAGPAKLAYAEGAAAGFLPAYAAPRFAGPAKLAYAEGAAAGFLPAYAAPKFAGPAKLAYAEGAAAGFLPAYAAPKFGAKIGLAEGVAASGYYPALAGGPAKLAYAEGAAAGFLPAYAAPKFAGPKLAYAEGAASGFYPALATKYGAPKQAIAEEAASGFYPAVAAPAKLDVAEEAATGFYPLIAPKFGYGPVAPIAPVPFALPPIKPIVEVAPIPPPVPVPIGGEFIDKNVFSGGKKNLNDLHFEKVHGNKGEEINEGSVGFNHGKAIVKDIKGDSGFYSGAEGGKKAFEDAKMHHGAQHYNQQGVNAGEKKINKAHKKGHVIKGYKSSHHKDESGNTEEFYDNENDEGLHSSFNGAGGSFGEKAESGFKGGHQNGEFIANEGKKAGHHNAEHIVDNANGGGGEFGKKVFGGSGAVYGANNGIDEQSHHGHHENSKIYKHHPYHAPFF